MKIKDLRKLFPGNQRIVLRRYGISIFNRQCYDLTEAYDRLTVLAMYVDDNALNIIVVD